MSEETLATKSDLLQLKLDIQESIQDGFSTLRSEMAHDEEKTQDVRRGCETRFQRIETFVETSRVLSSHKKEVSVPIVALLSAIVVVVIERLLAWIWR